MREISVQEYLYFQILTKCKEDSFSALGDFQKFDLLSETNLLGNSYVRNEHQHGDRRLVN
jgi:hypothetical protein